MPKYKGLPGPIPRTPEWHALRQFDRSRTDAPAVFGATEAAVVTGVSPYSTPRQLCMEKMGTIARKDISDKDAVRLGRELEPIVIREYERRTDSIVDTNMRMYLHPDHAFMGATPDGMRPGLVLDAKTTTHMRYSEFAQGEDALNKFGKEGSDNLPVDYVMQATQQMLVMGVVQADYAVLFDGRTMRIYRVELVQEIGEAIVVAENELSERMLENDLPEWSWRHKTTDELLKQVYPVSINSQVELPGWVEELWHERLEIMQTIKDLELQKREIDNKILSEMGEAQIGRLTEELQIKRVAVKESVYTQADIDKARSQLGGVKRKAYTYLLGGKPK